jgi:hypothetical protein
MNEDDAAVNINNANNATLNINNVFTFKRKLRSLTERILLIKLDLLYSINYIDGIEFTILGSSNKIYNVEIWRDSDLHYSCNCPDYKFRETTCKHIYWIGTKFFNTMDPVKWDLLDYNFIINNYLINQNIENYNIHIGRNEDCPVCLEKIDYQTESTICCIHECYNSVHTICWGRYNDISGSTQCIFCRADSMPNFL